MASNEKEDNCLNAIEIDYKKLFKQLVINIDSHKGQTINKAIIKQWVNQFDKQFSDKIDSRLKSSKISSKSMGNIVNRNKVDSTHISNDNLFTTNLSPIKKVRDNVENVDNSCHSDEEVIDSQQNDGIITQEISGELSEETIDKQSHNHNSIETRDVDIESDSIEIVENIDNNINYIEFLTDDIISDKLSESFGRDSDDNDINGDIGIDINHKINKSSDNTQINDIKSDDNCADSDSDRSKVNSEIETELINDDNQSKLLNEHKTNDNKVNDLEENSTNLFYDTNEELVYSEHNLIDTQNNTEMNNSDEDMNDRSLRPRKTVNDKSSESSDVEFNDSSDFADSSDNDSDDNDYTLSKQKTSKTANYSKYERLLKDQRFQMIASVELIKLSENMIEESDLAELCTDINSQEIKMFDTLRSNGFLCRKQMAKSNTRPKRDEDPEDREIRRLCRKPGLNKGKKRSNRNIVSQSSEEYNSDESNRKVEKKSRTKPKKLKKYSGDESDNELDSDSIQTNKPIKTNDSNPLITSTMSKKIDILDSDLSENEVLENSEKKSKTQKRSETNGDNSDSEVESKAVSNTTNKRIFDKVLRNANQEEKKESKPVIDLDSNSEEEVVPKKRAFKRKLSDDDDYCGEDNNSEKEEEEDSDSSVAVSEGMDPSLDSDSDFENDSKSRRKDKKKSKSKKSEKDNKEKKKKGRKRVVTEDTSDEDEVKILSGDDSEDSPNKSRKNLKKIISDKKLKQQTKDAAEAERDRRKRIIDKQKEYNDLIKSRNVKSAELKEVILEFDKKTKEPIVEVDEVLVKYLKPHQVDGIKFMYDCAIETIDQLESSPGSGCILAHSMGLGKTLQVITFLHTILSHKEINKVIKNALVICPVNTIRNWANEFKIWLNDHDLDNVLVFEMNDAKTALQRGEILNIWRKRGGVMIIGLTLFSSMVQGGRGKKPPKSVRLAIEKCLLDPGPDIAICDEGHLLKNEKTAYNKAVSKLKTLRRVVLTGTPLQNNLSEYYVMVNFVKPNLLGTKKEFTNRFANPITNGQHVDSTDYDVKIMKKRVHILHTLLNGCVHRCDYGVLVPYLQPKHEYVISVKLSELQIDLYSYYLQNLTDKQRFSLLADYGVLRLVWNHPSLLYEQHQRKIDKDTEDSIEDFIDDDDAIDTPVSGDSDIECMDDNNKPSTSKYRRRVRTRFGKHESEPEEEEEKVEEKETDFFSDAWFSKFMNREESKKIELSGKFILLFSILEECEKVGDKILLFTQSLDTLDLVEELLKLKFEEYRQKTKESVPEIDLESEYLNDVTHRWVKNIDYFRLDGSTSSDYRKAWVDIFNDETNFRARLFLVSTKAGGLGINLVGANRCIIFDASWNPTHDVQAIFRVFRFGQKKPVYIYRFVAQGTMEEKIYERQIIKQSLSCRVIDEQQIQRHFKASEMSELYVFNPDKSKDRPTPVLPKDRLLAEMLIKHKDFIINYHEHDSLLENKPEEEMTEEEKQTAWNEYEQEKDGVFLREQQEQEMRRRRELLLQQQQQAFQQQQQQQQQYAQMYQQIYQNMAGNSNSTVNLETLLQQQIYQNIMKSQENIRKQQQQAYRQQMQQQMQQQSQQQTQPQTQAVLPSYGVMTVEDIAKYLKNLNNSIDSQTLVTRIFSILTNGKQTCQKEILTIQSQLEEKPRDAQLKKNYHKVAQEIQNLNLQEERARLMFKLPASRTVPNIRPNSYQFPNQPTVIEPDESTPQYSSSNPKPSSVLIEEVD